MGFKSHWTSGGSLALVPAHLRGGWHRLHSSKSHCRIQALLPSSDRCPKDSASPLSAQEEQDSSQFSHSLLDDVPVFPAALLISHVVFPAKFIYCQMLLTLLSLQLMQVPDFYMDSYQKVDKPLAGLLWLAGC